MSLQDRESGEEVAELSPFVACSEGCPQSKRSQHGEGGTKVESAKEKPESPKPAPKAEASKAKSRVKAEAAKTKRQPVKRVKATKSGRAQEDVGPAKKK